MFRNNYDNDSVTLYVPLQRLRPVAMSFAQLT